MNQTIRSALGLLLGVSGALAAAGCDDYLTVTNPNVVDAAEIDPVTDAATLALSAQQDFAAAYGRFVLTGGTFSGEAWSSDVNAAGNLFATRRVDRTLGGLENLFGQLSVARALSDRVLAALAGTPGETTIHATRAALFSGYSFLVMAEYFCEGTVSGGPPLSTAMMADSAAARFSHAVTVGRQVGASAAALVDAALVGRARAHLLAGRRAEAVADAEAVSAGFTFALAYIDDLANRARLGNYLWDQTVSQTTVSAAPAFRNLGDPRVVLIPPEVNKHVPMDGVTEIWSMQKYSSYSAPIRLASRLEADYVAAEARGSAAMLEMIQRQRAANGQPAYAGPTDEAAVLREFLEQRGRDFFMEGKRMGDLRRHGAALPHLVPAGTPYHKNNYAPYDDVMCLPLPFKEVANNPNFRP